MFCREAPVICGTAIEKQYYMLPAVIHFVVQGLKQNTFAAIAVQMATWLIMTILRNISHWKERATSQSARLALMTDLPWWQRLGRKEQVSDMRQEKKRKKTKKMGRANVARGGKTKNMKSTGNNF